MNIAPTPDPDRANRPEEQALSAQIEAVTVPLLAAGLPCDIESRGNHTAIVIDLPDGSHLEIASDYALSGCFPYVTGWLVTLSRPDNPMVDVTLYDSTDDCDHALHGADAAPMLDAIAVHLTSVPDAETQRAGTSLCDALAGAPQLFNVTSLGASAQHVPTKRFLSGRLDSHRLAVKEYGWQIRFLEEAGWIKVDANGDTEWPLTVWQRNGVVQTVFVALAR